MNGAGTMIIVMRLFFSGAKARLSITGFAARLKSCPDTKQRVEVRGFPPIAKNAMDGHPTISFPHTQYVLLILHKSS